MEEKTTSISDAAKKQRYLALVSKMKQGVSLKPAEIAELEGYEAMLSADKTPSTNGSNGRDVASGRFVPGYKGGPGNPHAKQVARLRSALLATIQPDDMVAVAKILIKRAKGGNLAAIKELFDRSLGKPLEADLLDQLETLEKAVSEHERKWENK